MALPQDLIDEFVGASHGDLDRVKELLAQHPDLLQGRARWDETPLGAAAHTGAEGVAQFLLAAGAPIEICAAAMLGMTDRVRAMLEADPHQAHATGAHGISVLYHAAIRGRIDVAELLLARGADVNVGTGGNAALHGAAAFGQTAMVEWLLARGGHVDAPDYNRRTALRLALDNGHHEVAEILRRHGGTG